MQRLPTLLGIFQQKLLLLRLVSVLQFSVVDSDQQSLDYVTVNVDLFHTDNFVIA